MKENFNNQNQSINQGRSEQQLKNNNKCGMTSVLLFLLTMGALFVYSLLK